ncbi:MAG: glycosyltransferase family 25 protein [Spirochaetia bacterium]|jgi:glycosyl transferase family 25
MNAKLKNSAIWLANTLYNRLAKEAPPYCRLSQDSFRAMNEYFDVIWVLTIARNSHRRAHIEKQFAGLKFEYFDGVDGKTIIESDPRVDFYQASIVNRRPFQPNEAACALSHFSMLQAVVDRGFGRALIFEDDAAPVPRAIGWIPYCLERLPGDWELFYLGYRDGELRGYLREFQERLGLPGKPEEVVSRSVCRGLRTAAGHELIHAYAVTLAGARKILEGAYPIRDVADGWIERKVLTRKIKAYISIPKIFVQQSELGSSIHGR